nr:hypothetical protein [Tanacetum cinerariifolium]
PLTIAVSLVPEVAAPRAEVSVDSLVLIFIIQLKLKLLDDAADIKLRLLEQSAAVDEKMKKYC